MIRATHVRAGLRVLKRHLRYAGGNPRKLYWVARRAVTLAREGAIRGVLERHAAEELRHGDYAAWCERFEPPADCDYGPRLAALGHQPLFSILLPVHDVPAAVLAETIASVRAQCYRHWELCIVDDASADVALGEALAREAALDPRIRLRRRAVNGGIATATNDALSLATGEFCGFLDHDDRLAPDALLCMAEEIARNPRVALLFSDEDRIDGRGQRTAPHFKPDWDEEWIRTTNCVLHFMVVEAAALRELGGLAEGLDGAQDWDLVLRVAEFAGRERIRHVPHVLYHWRELPGSTAAAAFEKPALVEAQRRVIEQTLARRDERAQFRLTTSGWRIRYALPEPAPLVSIVIPTRDRADLLRACIESLTTRTTYPRYELVLVDNDSRAPDALALLDELGRSGRARVIRYPHPFNYSAQCNLGVREARGTMIALVNNDIEVGTDDWLEELVSLAARPGVGLVGATLFYPDGTLQHAGVILGLNGVGDRPWIGTRRGFGGPQGRTLAVRQMSGMITACAVVDRKRYLDAGGMNEALAVSCNDLDLCLRLARAGHRNVVTPNAVLVHHESASRGLADDPANRSLAGEEEARFAALWPREIASDPLYNPNLALSGAAYALAWPPRVARTP